jgi:hypothetical protein
VKPPKISHEQPRHGKNIKKLNKKRGDKKRINSNKA